MRICLAMWALLFGVLPAAANQGANQPTITPLFTRVDESPAFYVECPNDTGRAVSSAADIWPWAPGRSRRDRELAIAPRPAGSLYGCCHHRLGRLIWKILHQGFDTKNVVRPPLKRRGKRGHAK